MALLTVGSIVRIPPEANGAWQGDWPVIEVHRDGVSVQHERFGRGFFRNDAISLVSPPDDLGNRFAYHPANTAEKQAAHEAVRDDLLAQARTFAEELPDGREKSLALTKLEEAMFWANAAIARSGN